MNKELLLKVKAAILEHPEKIRMAHWHSVCGTTHCIAGWAQVLAGNEPHEYNCRYQARLALGIDSHQADLLFLTHNWPNRFWQNHNYARRTGDSKLLAQVVSERIDHFIATNGAE